MNYGGPIICLYHQPVTILEVFRGGESLGKGKPNTK